MIVVLLSSIFSLQEQLFRIHSAKLSLFVYSGPWSLNSPSV